VLVDRSIEHSKIPTKKGYIRSIIDFQVRIITKGSMDATFSCDECCYITAMNLTDIKGWIPMSVVNSSNVNISLEELRHIDKVAYGITL